MQNKEKAAKIKWVKKLYEDNDLAAQVFGMLNIHIGIAFLNA